MRTKVQSADLGAFLLHCHIAPHSAMGMSMTWAMDVDELRTSQAMKAYSE
jgi:FtsP/CotA-like multicopper oxidase with cupredoxin domain